MADAIVTYTATANDAVDGATPVTCAPQSGSKFTVGTSKVVCTSIDDAGNTSAKSFTVHVKAADAEHGTAVL